MAPRNRKRSRRPASPYLPDDLVARILLRLPSITSVARAALASKQWLRVASSRAFLRDHRARNPSAPLLGHFSFHHDTRGPPTFHPALVRNDPDLAAALRRGDFFLTSLTESYWTLHDCRGGLLLLSEYDDLRHRRLVVVDPASGRGDTIRRIPRGFVAHCLLPGSSAADDVCNYRSFRVVSVEHSDEGGARASEYDSRTGESIIHPWAEGIRKPALNTRNCYFAAMYAAGRIYWKYRKGDSLLSLDSRTMEFSYVRLPPGVYMQSPYAVGETEDGECCLVSVVNDNTVQSPWMQVWIAAGESQEAWVLQREVSLGTPTPCGKVQIQGRVRQVRVVVAGLVLLCTDHYSSGHLRHIAFRLKSLSAEAEFLCRGWAYPYLMAWRPPFTLASDGCKRVQSILRGQRANFFPS